MRDIERRAFLKRCDENNLQAGACALRGAVELDARLFTQQAVTGSHDSITEVAADAPEVKAAFRSSSFSSASASFACNLCTQVIRVRESHGDLQDSAVEIQTVFPLQCRAYTDVMAADLEALNAASADR
jgi:hypothetical protein